MSEDETPPCKTHPDAPHGFDRNASHNADRYVCECEGWEPPVKSYCGGKPNYCTTQEPLGSEWVPCVKLPVIVHVRNQREGETHISTREGITPVLPDDLIMRGVAGEEYPIGRELFERTYTFDVDAVNISQERVDETAKGEQEPVAWMWKDGSLTSDPDYADGTWTPLYTAPPKKEWVGLTDEEIDEWTPEIHAVVHAIEAKLREKNT